MSDKAQQEQIEMYSAFKDAVAPHFTEEGELMREAAYLAIGPLHRFYSEQHNPAVVDLLAIAAVRDMSRKALSLAALRDNMDGIAIGNLEAELLVRMAE